MIVTRQALTGDAQTMCDLLNPIIREGSTTAHRANVQAIDASIRADNPSGLAHYEKLGFRDYSCIKGMVLSNGTVVDKIRKRFDIA